MMSTAGWVISPADGMRHQTGGGSITMLGMVSTAVLSYPTSQWWRFYYHVGYDEHSCVSELFSWWNATPNCWVFHYYADHISAEIPCQLMVEVPLLCWAQWAELGCVTSPSDGMRYQVCGGSITLLDMVSTIILNYLLLVNTLQLYLLSILVWHNVAC